MPNAKQPQERLRVPDLPPSSADTDSYLSDVTTGKVLGDELPYRFRATGGYARGQFGTFAVRRSNGVDTSQYSVNAIEETRPNPTRAQQEVITRVAQTREALTSSEARLTGVASYLSDVTTGKVLGDELPYRFRATGGYARGQFGTFAVRRSNGVDTSQYSVNAIEETRPNPTRAQQEVITRAARNAAARKDKVNAPNALAIAGNIIADRLTRDAIDARMLSSGLDASMKQELSALDGLRTSLANAEFDQIVVEALETRDDSKLVAAVRAERDKYADISDEGSVRASVGTLEAYAQAARRVLLRAKFWKQAEDPDAELGQLERYEEVDINDTELVRELRGEALAVRRDRLFINAYRAVAGKTPDYQAAAMFLSAAASVVGTLKDEEGLDSLAKITNDVYSAEVASVFAKAASRLEIDRGKIAEVREEIKASTIRPAIAGVEFFDKFEAENSKFQSLLDGLTKIALDREIVELRKRFLNDADVGGTIDTILDLPGDDEEAMDLRQGLIDELAFTVTATRGLNPARFVLLKELEVSGIRARRFEDLKELDLAATNPERRAASVSNIVTRYNRAVMPLFETMRGSGLAEKYVSGITGERASYVQRAESLREQRELTGIEEAYLDSVESLTVFNPHLVALLREAPELTSLHLEQYFADMDARTKEQLTNDMYVPALQIGLGPNGLAAAGEVNRSNPALAKSMLYIDAAAMPGGPFGVAKGQSWELNSANSISQTTNILPDVSGLDTSGASVRSYGSPLVSYPGERKKGADVRQGSINVTVDYLPNPDNISTKRYPTNVDLARVLQLQAAMLTDNVLLSTRVLQVEPVDDGQPGNKRVTIEFDTASGEAITTTIRTDSIVVAGGLGEPNYGIRLEGSEAQRIINKQEQGQDGFPRITDTIGAFEELSRPEGSPSAPKGVIVIYGGGNSADVLIEYLGRQFESGNPNLNGITKVYVVTNAPLSQRPRYAQINDLKSRNGQPSFLEIVPARVADVREVADGKLELLDARGEPIMGGQNGSRGVIMADHVIAASGFRPQLDEVFGPLLAPGESLDKRENTNRVALPSNPGFGIADRLQNDPGVLVVGTASRADYQNPAKLAQLPPSAREALLRNGAENAVAIGFRTPDTRAAIRLQFEDIGPTEITSTFAEREKQIIDTSTISGTQLVAVSPDMLLPTRRDVDSDSETLTALFLNTLPAMELQTDGSPSKQRRDYTIRVTLDEASQNLQFASNGTPSKLLDIVREGFTNPYVVSYALDAMRRRRTNRGLELQLAFNRGKLVYRDSGSADKGRTYVEAL